MFTGKYDEKPEHSYLLNVLLIIMPFLSLYRGVELLLSGELGLNGLYIPLPSYLNKGKGYQLLVRGIVQPFVIDQWRNTFSPVRMVGMRNTNTTFTHDVGYPLQKLPG